MVQLIKEVLEEYGMFWEPRLTPRIPGRTLESIFLEMKKIYRYSGDESVERFAEGLLSDYGSIRIKDTSLFTEKMGVKEQYGTYPHIFFRYFAFQKSSKDIVKDNFVFALSPEVNKINVEEIEEHIENIHFEPIKRQFKLKRMFAPDEAKTIGSAYVRKTANKIRGNIKERSSYKKFIKELDEAIGKIYRTI